MQGVGVELKLTLVVVRGSVFLGRAFPVAQVEPGGVAPEKVRRADKDGSPVWHAEGRLAKEPGRALIRRKFRETGTFPAFRIFEQKFAYLAAFGVGGEFFSELDRHAAHQRFVQLSPSIKWQPAGQALGAEIPTRQEPVRQRAEIGTAALSALYRPAQSPALTVYGAVGGRTPRDKRVGRSRDTGQLCGADGFKLKLARGAFAAVPCVFSGRLRVLRHVDGVFKGPFLDYAA